MPGLPIHHQLLEFTQTHVHWVSDAIQPSHPLLSPSPTINLSQHQGLFKWIIHIRWPKYWSFSFSISPMNIQDWFPLGWTGWISLQSKGLSRVFSNATVLKHQFFSAQLSFFFIFFKLYIIVLVLPNIKMNPPQVYFIVQLSHPYMTTGKTIALTRWIFFGKVMFLLF